MPKYDKYHPDYGRLYPEIQMRPDVLSVLKKSDRKMEYMEVDIKQERFSYDPEGKVANLLPGREDSYDRLMEEEHRQFSIDEPTPETVMLHEEELWLLRTALLQLTAEEKALIDALFYQEEGKNGRQPLRHHGGDCHSGHGETPNGKIDRKSLMKEVNNE